MQRKIINWINKNRSKYTDTQILNALIKKLEPKEVNIPFDTFYQLYDYKKSKTLAEKSWNALTDEERTITMKVLPDYVASTNKDGTYPTRKHPSTYLNQKCWNDEIVVSAENKKAEKETKLKPKRFIPDKEPTAEDRARDRVKMEELRKRLKFNK